MSGCQDPAIPCFCAGSVSAQTLPAPSCTCKSLRNRCAGLLPCVPVTWKLVSSRMRSRFRADELPSTPCWSCVLSFARTTACQANKLTLHPTQACELQDCPPNRVRPNHQARLKPIELSKGARTAWMSSELGRTQLMMSCSSFTASSYQAGGLSSCCKETATYLSSCVV